MTRVLLFAAVILGVGLPVAVFFTGGYSVFSVIQLVVGIGWIYGLLRRWMWVSIPGLFLIYAFAAAGFFLPRASDLRTGPAALPLLFGAFFGLLAWDLGDFHARLLLASPEDDIPGLERRHLLRLAAFALLGAVVTALALTLRVTFAFEWSVILILFATWGLGRIVSGLLERE